VEHQPLATSTKQAVTGAAVLALLIPASVVLIAAGQQDDVRCNDACSAYRHHGVVAGEPWYRSADAWQWGFQYWLAVACLIALIIAFGLAVRGRWRAALIAALTAIVWLVGFFLPIP
jgi:hypothetical protein